MISLYESSKAGLERFSLALASELVPVGIRVTTVRAGAMSDAEKVWEVEPAMRMRFVQACMAAGLDFRKMPISEFTSVTELFRAVIDLPPDVRMELVTLRARALDH